MLAFNSIVSVGERLETILRFIFCFFRSFTPTRFHLQIRFPFKSYIRLSIFHLLLPPPLRRRSLARMNEKTARGEKKQLSRTKAENCRNFSWRTQGKIAKFKSLLFHILELFLLFNEEQSFHDWKRLDEKILSTFFSFAVPFVLEIPWTNKQQIYFKSACSALIGTAEKQGPTQSTGGEKILSFFVKCSAGKFRKVEKNEMKKAATDARYWWVEHSSLCAFRIDNKNMFSQPNFSYYSPVGT